MAPLKVYVECNPMLDISAVVSDEFMAKYKVERAAATLMADDQKGIFAELEQMPDVKYIPGGSGLNTARVAQWLLQAPRDTFVSYVGCVADDRYGQLLRESAEKEGVTMALEYTTKEVTGSCAVCITGKERSLVANLAAANCLSAEHMHSEKVQKLLGASELFYVTGYTLTVDVAHILMVAQKSREVHGTLLINLSAPFILQFFGQQLDAVLPYVDIIIGNAMEAQALAAAREWDTEDVKEIVQRAMQELPYSGTRERIIIITQGPNPTVCYTRKDGIMEVPVPWLDQDKIVDLNTAGDAFVGGFLAAYAVGRDLKRCCDVGSYAAQVIIQHDSCTYPEKPSITP